MDVDQLIARGVDQVRREIKRMKVMREQLCDAEIDCTSRDGSVKLTQTLGGETIKVEIRPGTFDRHDEASFGKLLTELLQASRRAGQQSATKLTEQILQAQGEKNHD